LAWRKREKENKREGGVEKEVDRRKEKEREERILFDSTFVRKVEI
jgi:hypothetical protein